MERLSLREPTHAVSEDAPGGRQKVRDRQPVVRAAPGVPEIADAGSRDRLVATPDAGHRIQRSTAETPLIAGPPAGSRIHRASDPVIRRVVKSIQVGKKKKTTKWYTTLDTKENVSYFDTREGAEALEAKIRSAQTSTKTTGTVAPTTKVVASESTTTGKVTPAKVTTEKVTTEKATTPPVTTAPISYASALTGKPSTPVVTSPVVTSPVTSSPATKSPAITTSPGNKSPAVITSPVITSPSTKSPAITTSPGNKSPAVITSPVITSPSTKSAAITTSSGTKSPSVITSPKPSETAVITSPGTKSPAVTTSPSPKTTQPATVAVIPRPMTQQELWRAKQDEVTATLSPFVEQFRALDPDASLRVRGSLASGFKGAQKALDTGERPLFNPKDFDIDAYVVSDTLYAQALDSGNTTDEAVKGKIPGSYHPKVNEIIRKMRDELATIPGNRDAKQTWHFNVIIRSSRNAAFTERGDREDAFSLGHRGYGGYLGVPEPVDKSKK